jgi:16S rRNA (adenine1518-N6/adenine1519-N6)-dimethyltransferase
MAVVEEIFDVCDEHDRVIGRAPRSVVHARKLLHRAVHIFVFNSRCELLLQRRTATKDECPLKLTSSASGHLAAGESYEHAALRELKEELGISGELEYLKTFPASPETLYEHTALFRLKTDAVLTPDPAEVLSIEPVTLTEVEWKLSRNPDDYSPPLRVLLTWYLEQRGQCQS